MGLNSVFFGRFLPHFFGDIMEMFIHNGGLCLILMGQLYSVLVVFLAKKMILKLL
jgi:hypothetical protein